MKALLLVDVQNDFLPGGVLGIEGADQIVPIINSLIDKFACIVATKDWHPNDHISFAKTHGKEPGEVIEVENYRQELWPVHCIQNSSGSEFSPHLRAKKICKVFLKGIDPQIDSYSTFFDNARKRSTGLGEYLKKIGVKELYIAGLATDYCVKYSVLHALELGFKVYVILDGCAGIELNPGDIQQAIDEMRAAGAEVIDSQSFQI